MRRVIPGLHFDNVREHGLDWIWHSPEYFRFRREEWMPEPCLRDAKKKILAHACQAFSVDWGRCQGKGPVCELAPRVHHD